MVVPPGDSRSAVADRVDITKDFFGSVQCLELGELLHAPSFGLFEAMSAIEMMDPKMDAGMVCNKGKREILNFEQSLKAGDIKLNDFTESELVGIMDTTISCLVTWTEGHSSAQTVFTNLFLHSPTSIEDKYLRSFCIGVLKLVDIIEECVSKAGVFEEEDFQLSVYGYNLATQFNDSKTNALLRECEDELNKKIKAISKADADPGPLSAVVQRIKFVRVFYSLLNHIWKRENNLAETAKVAQSCQDCLELLEKNHHIGIKRSTDESEKFMLGFELLVNQRLLPPTFPRSTQIKSIEETYSFLHGLLQRVQQILHLFSSGSSFHAILEFFFSFSESRPCVLSRSLLQLLYSPRRYGRQGVDDIIDAMKDSVRGFIAPAVMSTSWKNSASGSLAKEVLECVEMFFDRCTAPFASLILVCGHNRARQRDKLAQLMEDFAFIQLETERIDAFIQTLTTKLEMRGHNNCFSIWLLYHISRIMIQYILIGFELELYSVHELSYIYYYLFEILYGWLLSALSRAETLLGEDAAAKSKAKSGSKKSKAKPTKSHNREICFTQAQQSVAGGVFKIIMGFLVEKKISLPESEFDNEGVRYRHRFSPFNSIRTPAPVHYSQYRSTADLNYKQPPRNLYMTAAQHFHQAKQLLEVISVPSTAQDKEIQALLKVAKTNLVVAKLLASGHTKESTQSPEFDFSVHTHFPIIKVK